MAKTNNTKLWEDAQKENTIFEDIVFLDFTDSFYNLSLKTMGMSKWFVDNYNFDYMLKTVCYFLE